MTQHLNIRKCGYNDADEVRALLQLTWQKAYSPFIPQSDLDSYLNKEYSVTRIQEIFHNPNFICFVAEVKMKICGWLKLTINKNEDRFYLSSIYILPDYQKLKIGDKLFQTACNVAKQKEFNEIYVGVMNQNKIALQWYEKLGFKFFEELPFIMGETSIPHLIGKLTLSN
jgi:ribosomal protein S18 acetylase RimI-like enzyme